MLHMSSKADETPCTLLYHINDQLVDVAKGTIIKPCDRLLPGQPMPSDAFRVSVACVMWGHDSLPSPLLPRADNDESQASLVQCKNCLMVWPKSLIRVEASGSTPMATPCRSRPIEGNTTTPIQLQPSVLVGQIIHEEGGPSILVADHVGPVDQEDEMEEDDIS